MSASARHFQGSAGCGDDANNVSVGTGARTDHVSVTRTGDVRDLKVYNGI